MRNHKGAMTIMKWIILGVIVIGGIVAYQFIWGDGFDGITSPGGKDVGEIASEGGGSTGLIIAVAVILFIVIRKKKGSDTTLSDEDLNRIEDEIEESGEENDSNESTPPLTVESVEDTTEEIEDGLHDANEALNKGDPEKAKEIMEQKVNPSIRNMLLFGKHGSPDVKKRVGKDMSHFLKNSKSTSNVKLYRAQDFKAILQEAKKPAPTLKLVTDALKNLKVGDVIVSKSGTKRTVLKIDGKNDDTLHVRTVDKHGKEITEKKYKTTSKKFLLIRINALEKVIPASVETSFNKIRADKGNIHIKNSVIIDDKKIPHTKDGIRRIIISNRDGRTTVVMKKRGKGGDDLDDNGVLLLLPKMEELLKKAQKSKNTTKKKVKNYMGASILLKGILEEYTELKPEAQKKVKGKIDFFERELKILEDELLGGTGKKKGKTGGLPEEFKGKERLLIDINASAEDVLWLINTVKVDHLQKEPVLIKIPKDKKVIFIGDTHSDFETTKKILHDYWDKVDNFVFLGDYVDRAEKEYGSIKNINLLLSYKNLAPEKIIMLRGNHEDPNVFSRYGLLEELQERYPDDFTVLTNAYSELFKELPLMVLTENGIFAAHAGIPDPKKVKTVKNLEKIKKGKRIVPEEKNDTVIDTPQVRLTWADTVDERGNVTERLDGASGKIKITQNTLSEFLKNIGAKIFLRGHDQAIKGNAQFNDTCLTIFSCKKYETKDYGNIKGIFAVKVDLSKNIESVKNKKGVFKLFDVYTKQKVEPIR